ncbi:hypothetical protein [Rhizobium sp. BR 314]|uniref:hypothetical protein n=1 Tax=Rhizobium sp. BR 314 TaxID=3040013 RepID=UPI0039BF834B
MSPIRVTQYFDTSLQASMLFVGTIASWRARQRHARTNTDVNALSHLARSFGMSRAYAIRKLAAAESIRGIGWRSRSQIRISRNFYKEYARAQACKLAAFKDGFHADNFSSPHPPRSRHGTHAVGASAGIATQLHGLAKGAVQCPQPR